MIEIARKPREKLFKRLQKFLSVTYHFDKYNPDIDVLEKYGYFDGTALREMLHTRFKTQGFAFEVVEELLLIDHEYYFIPVVGNTPRIYLASREDIISYMNEHTNDNICHFMVINCRLEWMILKGDYNHLEASGKIVRHKLRSIMDDNYDYSKVFVGLGGPEKLLID